MLFFLVVLLYVMKLVSGGSVLFSLKNVEISDVVFFLVFILFVIFEMVVLI